MHNVRSIPPHSHYYNLSLLDHDNRKYGPEATPTGSQSSEPHANLYTALWNGSCSATSLRLATYNGKKNLSWPLTRLFCLVFPTTICVCDAVIVQPKPCKRRHFMLFSKLLVQCVLWGALDVPSTLSHYCHQPVTDTSSQNHTRNTWMLLLSRVLNVLSLCTSRP